MKKRIKKQFSRVLICLIFLIAQEGCAQNNKQDKDPSGEDVTQSNEDNHLSDATSPYLRQHADNPVNWYKWGDKAFKKAEKADKLVIISIGYAACHWCHVMEHKSFMDTVVANYMNDNFISVKVDREQRPDVDDIYMSAARMITGKGGWPLNAIALPNGKPIVAGTYFPKQKWLRFLKRVKKAYDGNPERLRKQANKLTQGIQEESFIEPAESLTDYSMNDLDAYFNQDVVKNIDWKITYEESQQKGNKFPNPSNFAFQLHYYHLTGNDTALKAVTTTLDQMLRGGIYDQVGGGFSRYATDQMWKVPHFEKMLYDNAQLVSLYSKAYKITGHDRYKRVVTETLDFIDRVMTSPEGGFYSSLNADSEGEEGKYYVWTEEAIDKVLGDRKALVKKYYNIQPEGNWEHGKNVLFRKKSDEAFADKHGLSTDKLREIIDEAGQALMKARQSRKMPSKDNKILTSWNALMLKGYLQAYEAFGKQSYLRKALKNARFLKANMIEEDYAVKRVFKDGVANINGFLDDYANMINAFTRLYEATFEKKWLKTADQLADYALTNFYDTSTGLFFYKSRQSEALIADQRDLTDNTKPSGNSAMANALVKLGAYYYQDHNHYYDTALKMLNNAEKKINKSPTHFGNWLTLMAYFTKKPLEVGVIGPNCRSINKELHQHYLPHSFFMGSEKSENLPLLKNRYVEGQTTIYVCQDRVCKQPVTDVENALNQMKELIGGGE